MCVKMKKGVGRMASTTSDTSDTSSKQQQAQRNTKTTSGRGPFHKSINVNLTGKEEKQLLILHMLQSTCSGSEMCVSICVLCKRVCVSVSVHVNLILSL